jgi:hypothetical protein
MERLAPTELRLTLDATAEARARDLTARETDCCSFFGFVFTPGANGEVHLLVSVPATHTEVLDALAVRAAGLRHD